MKKAKGTLLLLCTALIWGMAFVAQRAGMEYVGPITMQGVRCMLGCVSLLPVVVLRRRMTKAAEPLPSLKASLVCGVVFTVASTIQQTGIQYTTAGKAGFISALYVVLVPLFGLFFGRRVKGQVWISVVLSMVGLYMMSAVGELSMNKGDYLTLVSAVFFAVHIMAVGHYAPTCDGVALSCAQFLVAGALALPLALVVEKPAAGQILSAWMPLCYAGILSCGVAYTLQIIGQRSTPPTVASLVLCLESVFAALSGAVLLHERMSAPELGGCALMLFAVVLSQLPLQLLRRKEY